MLYHAVQSKNATSVIIYVSNYSFIFNIVV